MELEDDAFERFADALTELSYAKDGFSAILRALGVTAPRASKIAMTTEMNEAFARLVRAQEELDCVQARRS